MNRIQIADGVHLTVLPVEKFKRCRVAVHFIWPSRRETATAEALLPLLMERSYADCPDMTQLSKRLAALYGASLSVETSLVGANRVLSVSVMGIRDLYALAGEALSAEYAAMALGVAFRPFLENGLFCAADVAIEAEQLREQLESEINSKRGYCLRQARRKFYSDAPEGIECFGYLDEVDALTPESVTSAWHNMVKTAQMEVMVLGADENAVRAGVLDTLAAFSRCPIPMVQPGATARKDAQTTVEIVDAVQGKLCLLFTASAPVEHQDMSALRVAVALLGGIPTSRLFMNVREKRSLCYYCAASSLSRNGMLCIDSGMEHENATAAKQAILEEFDALCNGPITQKELEEAKRSLVCSLEGMDDTLASVEGWVLGEICRGTDNTPQMSMEQVEAVTVQDVQRMLQAFTLSVVYLLAKEGNANV